jgi:uncharacterized membrane protein YuzA (DUF378 family)
MLMTVLDLLVSTYQGILLAYTARRQFRHTCGTGWLDAAFVASYVAFIAVIQYGNIPIPDSLVAVILFAYMKLLTHERNTVCLLWTILDMFLLLGTLTLVSSLFNLQIMLNGTVLETSNETQIIYYFVGSAAITVVLNAAAKFSKASHAITKAETILFILTLFLCFLMNECFFMARLSGNENPFLVIGSACSFAVMLLTMILYDLLTEAMQKKQQMELAVRTAQLVAEHQEELKNIYTHLLSEQHDLRHRIAAAEELLSNTNVSQAQRNEVVSLLMPANQPRMFVTGCIAVDAILRAKLTVMENAGIAFDFDEYPLQSLPISEQNLCMLLGNLLDNAIEGVQRLPDYNLSRHIHLTFAKVWDVFFIVCINDANPLSIYQKGDIFQSSKTHPELHGFGIENMRRIVEEAGGTIDFQSEHGKFTVSITLGENSLCS